MINLRKFHIDPKRYIDHLFSIVFSSIGGNTLILTEQYDKFIDFLSIIYRYQFETILLQELGRYLIKPQLDIALSQDHRKPRSCLLKDKS